MSTRERKTVAALVTVAFILAVVSLTMAAYATQEPASGTAISAVPQRDEPLSDAAWAAISTMVGAVVTATTAVIVALRTNKKLPSDLTTGEAQTKLALEITRLNKIIDDYQETELEATARVNRLLDERPLGE